MTSLFLQFPEIYNSKHTRVFRAGVHWSACNAVISNLISFLIHITYLGLIMKSAPKTSDPLKSTESAASICFNLF